MEGECTEQVIADFDLSFSSRDAALAESDLQNLIRFRPKRGWPQGGTSFTLADLGDRRGLSTVFIRWGQIRAVAPDGRILPGWPVPLPGTGNSPVFAAGDLVRDGRDELILAGNPVTALSYQGKVLPGWPFTDLAIVPALARFAPLEPLRVVSTGGLFPPPPESRVTEGALFVLDERGKTLPGWPAVIPPLVTSQGKFSTRLQGPAVGDITGDGIAEVVTTDFNSNVWAADRNGRILPGFPVTIGRRHKRPSLGDLDADGAQEIVFWTDRVDPDTSGTPGVIVLDGNGGIKPGWPQITMGVGGGAPALGDVDRDGRLEVLASSRGGGVYLWNDDGTALPGWPKMIRNTSFSPFPIIADVDGDGVGDILVVGVDTGGPFFEGVIHAWRTDGQRVSGFPIVLRGSFLVSSQLTVADIDADGIAELGFNSNSGARAGLVYWLDLGVPYRPEGMEWPTWAHDMGRTGSYSPPVRTVEATVKVRPPLLPAATPMPPMQIILKIPKGEREPPGEIRLVAVNGGPIDPITGERTAQTGNLSAAVQVYRFPGEQVRAALPGPGRHQLTFESPIFGRLRGIQYRATGEVELADIPW